MHEVDQLVVYAYRRKLLREIKLRRRLAEKEVESAADRLLNKGPKAGSGIGSDAAFVEAVIDNLGVGDLFTGEMEDAEGEVADEDEEEDEEEAVAAGHRRRPSGEGDDERIWRPAPDLQRTQSGNIRTMSKPEPPELTVISAMLPTFIEMVRPMLRPARTASGSLLRGNSYDVFQNGTEGAPPFPHAQQNQQQQQQGWSSWLWGSHSQ